MNVKLCIAFVGGSCIVIFCVMTMSSSSTAPESTNLFGMPGLRSAQKTSVGLSPKMANLAAALPGGGPWKELALAGMESSGHCDRDVSVRASRVNNILATMDSKTQNTVAAVSRAAITKAEDLKAGITAPLGYFDPFGLSTDVEGGRLLFYREAELKHGRVCMLAALGFVVGEQWHPLFGGNIDVPSYISFQATPLQTFWIGTALLIALPEVLYSIPSFQPPAEGGTYKDKASFAMKEDRIPGDFGFDPLGLRPKDEKGFLDMQNKELNHGRLAMISVTGMIAQELVTGKKLF